MIGKRLFIAMILPTLLLAGCRTEWVQLTPEGEAVTLATSADVDECQRIGASTVNALDSIGFVQRSARQLQNELVRLARNEAGDMGGDHIVPESVITDGRQSFGVYRCQ
ncbi:MAG: DUF4156 domain-containing protein [Pseudomonadota bacterium]